MVLFGAHCATELTQKRLGVSLLNRRMQNTRFPSRFHLCTSAKSRLQPVIRILQYFFFVIYVHSPSRFMPEPEKVDSM